MGESRRAILRRRGPGLAATNALAREVKELSPLPLLLRGTGLVADPAEVAEKSDDQEDDQEPREELTDRPRGRGTDPERLGAPRDTLGDVIGAAFEESLGEACSFWLHLFLSELPAQLAAEVMGGGTGRAVEPEPEHLPHPVEREVVLVLEPRNDHSPGVRHLPRAEVDDPAHEPHDEVEQVGSEDAEDETEEERLTHPSVHLLTELPHGRVRLEPPPHDPVGAQDDEDQPEAVLQRHDVPGGDGEVRRRSETDELTQEAPNGLDRTADEAPEQAREREPDETGNDESGEPGVGDVLQIVLHGGSSE